MIKNQQLWFLHVDGGYDRKQVVPGKLAEFNMWNREMTADELNSETCGAHGNVVSWSTLQERGTAVKSSENFPRCAGKATTTW